jgi:hypothetical protein
VNGVLAGRIDYSVGVNAGSSFDTRPSENYYGHIGYKFGGMRLDGEGGSKVSNATRPWEEQAFTIDAFAYRSVNSANFADPDPAVPAIVVLDSATVFGGNLRVQLDSFELNAGVYWENHNHAAADGSGAKLLAPYGEVSYIVEPWFVPAVRVEYASLKPDLGPTVNNLRIVPGIASALRPNMKVVLTAALESASGQPPAGWSALGGIAAPGPNSTSTSVGLELENIQIAAFFAF